MRGSIHTRYKSSWNIILDMATRPDPETGKPKRIQTCIPHIVVRVSATV